jgi:propionyl-CoA carboxylase alpha chain
MFGKILIANRGEIALRILRTCRNLGIRTVAVFSDPDARSLHVRQADEAYPLGGTTAVESYLSQEKLISAALASGCQAIHPGYGFLSENPGFAQSVSEAGLTFIGPPSSVIALLGDKVAAKNLAREAGLPTVSGPHTPLDGLEDALKAAEKIGYPVLLKALGGGGGRGMRIVRSPEQMAEALPACQEEASKAFGDGRIFLEHYVDRPRHVEVQILADPFGTVLHLGERECSIQRRHQKIMEETPSPGINKIARSRMTAAACALARAAGYVNAGTVEFLLAPDGRFYFLEMNTRLQVEHGITELVTGIDLVEWQIRIAAGEKLPWRQEDLGLSGWAMEARICSENPAKAFAPSTGIVRRYAAPRGKHVRVDSGIEAGSSVSMYYDSLLAKVMAWGENREEARQRLVEALNGTHIEGVVTNVHFVNRILNHPSFIQGDLSTNFLAEHFQGDRSDSPPSQEHLDFLTIAVTLVYHNRRVLVRSSLKPMVSRIGSPPEGRTMQTYYVKTELERFKVTLRQAPEPGRWTVDLDGRTYDVRTPEFEFYRRRLKLEINGKTHRFILQYREEFIGGAFCGIERVFEIYSPREWELASFMPAQEPDREDYVVYCPMPGLVVQVCVAPGERVYEGQRLFVLESMKMESGVPSPCDGVVKEILVRENQPVETGDLLIRFKPQHYPE